MRRWEDGPDDPFPPAEWVPLEGENDTFGCWLVLICAALFWLIVFALIFDWGLPWL